VILGKNNFITFPVEKSEAEAGGTTSLYFIKRPGDNDWVIFEHTASNVSKNVSGYMNYDQQKEIVEKILSTFEFL